MIAVRAGGITAQVSGCRSTRNADEKSLNSPLHRVVGEHLRTHRETLRATRRRTLVRTRSTHPPTPKQTKRETLKPISGTREPRCFAPTARGCPTAKVSGCRSTRNVDEKDESVRCTDGLGSFFALNEKGFAQHDEKLLARARSTHPLSTQPTKRETIELTNRTRQARLSALTARGCPTARLSGCK
ncbi:hypothetical protein ACKFKF_12395 [Phormidesmis sp. 146-12]